MNPRPLLEALLNEDAYVAGGLFPRPVTVAAPAAGADWSVKVDGGEVWMVLDGTATLATSVAVASRSPRLIGTDGNVTYRRVGAGVDQAASLTVAYSINPGAGAGNTAGASSAAWPTPVPLVVPPSHSIGTNTGAIQAADQWSAIALLVLVGKVSGVDGWAERELQEAAKRIAARVNAVTEDWQNAASVPPTWPFGY